MIPTGLSANHVKDNVLGVEHEVSHDLLVEDYRLTRQMLHCVAMVFPTLGMWHAYSQFLVSFGGYLWELLFFLEGVP